MSSVNLHNRAGVAALLAALADQERSGSFALEHLLGLRSTQLPDEPIGLVLMGQVLLVSLQHVGAETTRWSLNAALSSRFRLRENLWGLTRPDCRSVCRASR